MSNLIRPTQSTYWLPLIQLLPHRFFLMLMIFLKIRFYKRCISGPRANTIPPELGRVVPRQLACHGHDGALGSAVGKALLNTDHPRPRADIYHAPMRGAE